MSLQEWMAQVTLEFLLRFKTDTINSAYIENLKINLNLYNFFVKYLQFQGDKK